jgi:MoxR-like ATPase
MFKKMHAVAQQVSQIVVGKELQVRQALTCLLAGGHLLVEDVPGVGKTTLAHALAISLGLKFNRVQFTSDLLPADVAGISIYERETNGFVFHPGPIFTQVLLADEINRATPKTQSGLLEAMEERQVSADGPRVAAAVLRHRHAEPGAPGRGVPAARVAAGPVPDVPVAGLPGRRRRTRAADGRGPAQHAQVAAGGDAAGRTGRGPAGAAPGACVGLADRLRAGAGAGLARDGLFAEGLSPRAAIALLQAARAWAALEGRDHVVPEDVQAVLVPVCAHRLRPLKSAHGVALASRDLVLQLQKSVPL